MFDIIGPARPLMYLDQIFHDTPQCASLNNCSRSIVGGISRKVLSLAT